MTSAPFSKVLPQWVDPIKMAVQGVSFEGVVASDQLTELAKAIVSTEGPVIAELQFYCDGSGHRVVSGKITAQVWLACQRCLQNMGQRIEISVSWGIATDEQRMNALPKRYAPWLVEEEGGNLHGIIEEELLLALPIVAIHDAEECGGTVDYSTDVGTDKPSAKKPSPFDILHELKLGK